MSSSALQPTASARVTTAHCSRLWDSVGSPSTRCSTCIATSPTGRQLCTVGIILLFPAFAFPAATFAFPTLAAQLLQSQEGAAQRYQVRLQLPPHTTRQWRQDQPAVAAGVNWRPRSAPLVATAPASLRRTPRVSWARAVLGLWMRSKSIGPAAARLAASRSRTE